MGQATNEIEAKSLSFGKRLAMIRKARGLTQTALGKKISVSQRIMHHYENKAEYPPPGKLIELARALEMTVDELLQIDQTMESWQNINPNLAKRLRKASALPPYEVRVLATFIDALVLKQEIKKQDKREK